MTTDHTKEPCSEWTDGLWTCAKCGAQTTSHYEHRLHLQLVHNISVPAVSMSASKGAFRFYIGEPGKELYMNATHKCADCPASFWDADGLERHRKDAHEDKGTQTWASAAGAADAAPNCGVCGMGFRTDADFIQHVFREHRARYRNDDESDTRITDHAEAAAAALQRIVDRLRVGESPEDIGPDVVLLGRVMSRRT